MTSLSKILVVGHRGYAGFYPENTLIAFDKALELGVDGVECDVHLTLDDQVVIYHDAVLNPETTKDSTGHWLSPNSLLYLKNLTYAELLTYTVGEIRPGSKYALTHPKVKSIPGISIPTLAQLLERAQYSQNKEKLFFIELKTSPFTEDHLADPAALVPAVLKVIQQAQVTPQVILQSFDGRTLELIRNLASDINFHALFESTWEANSLWLEPFKPLQETETLIQCIRRQGGKAWSPPFHHEGADYLTLDHRQQAQDQGLKLFVWTPNTVQDLQKMVDLEVDGIITDRPDLLLTILKTRA